MTPTRYAIKCSTEEQAEECNKRCKNFSFVYFVGEWENYREGLGYTIITYEEAKEKGLLGKKKECFYCGESKCNCEQQEIIERHIADNKPQQEEDVVEKVVKERIDTHGEKRAIYWREMEKILRNHLSSKK